MKLCLGCFRQIKDELQVCPFCGYIEGTLPEEAVHIIPGTMLIERYIVGRVLGFGGFGVTYIGWDTKLEQKVAIKEYLPSEFSTRMPGRSSVTVFNGVKQDQFVSGLNKFVDEAKRLSKFQKEDGIVRIYDCIADNGTAYIIMEYLEGETLSDRLKRVGFISEREAVDMLMPIMRSLVKVHKERIIHRDISPDNIFITKDGAKLIDFGAARYATTSHSRSLTVIIKPGYSAEEQYRSRSDQGQHTDVYSLAATLYKMITGETPPDALERRAKIENNRKDILVEPRKINSDISLITENAILNAMNIRIEDRTPTVYEFVSDLNSDDPVVRKRGKIKRIDLYGLPRWLRILVPTILIIFIVIEVLIMTGVISFDSHIKTDVEVPDGYVLVPNVEGMSIDGAIEVLQAAGLDYISGGSAEMDYVSADTIAYQTPEVGRIIPIGSSIELVVSRGSGDIVLPSNGYSTIPAYMWSNLDSVISDFTVAGLDTSVTYVYRDNVAPGLVVGVLDSSDSELASGDCIEEGSTIMLLVATDDMLIDSFEYSNIGDRSFVTQVIGDLPDEVIIPALSVDGCTVDGLANYCFAGNESITTVVIPENVTSIGFGAFEGCKSLSELTIPESVNSIREGAFANCPSLNSINGMSPETWVSMNGFNQNVFVIHDPSYSSRFGTWR